jgi:hypothetical protein
VDLLVYESCTFIIEQCQFRVDESINSIIEVIYSLGFGLYENHCVGFNNQLKED